MYPTCGATQTFDFKERYCTLRSGHTGQHWDRTTGDTWSRYSGQSGDRRYKAKVTGQFHETDEVVLKLTLEELKGLVYALSSPDWKKDEPELVAKVDKALKEAL